MFLSLRARALTAVLPQLPAILQSIPSSNRRSLPAGLKISTNDSLGLNSSDPWDVPSRLAKPGWRSLVNPGNPNNYIKTQCFEIPTAPSLSFYNQNCDTSMGTYPQCFNLRGNAGRNILIGRGTSNLDFLLFKNIPITRIREGFNVQCLEQRRSTSLIIRTFLCQLPLTIQTSLIPREPLALMLVC
jgi:hypothetical protein